MTPITHTDPALGEATWSGDPAERADPQVIPSPTSESSSDVREANGSSAIVRLARPCGPPTVLAPFVPGLHALDVQRPPARQEFCCVASAVCGLTAVIPFVSQIAGVVLGIIGLVRIRRGRRLGIDRRGTGWAIVGLVSSGFMLLCWLVIVGVLAAAGHVFRHGVADHLNL